MIATAPGKLILTGEYAVLDGAPAMVVAVDRRVVARTITPGSPHGTQRQSSPFLLAVIAELAARRGADDPATRAAAEITVDSTAFYTGPAKLGLGSSAAVTVAATALALALADGRTSDSLERDEVLAIALAAHAAAQGPRGSRGSGADITAAVTGGTLVFAGEHGRTERRAWPEAIRLLAFFTGASADTAQLVARVASARAANRSSVDAALVAIGEASRVACAALAAPRELVGAVLIGAFALASHATDRLAAATGVDLVPACVTAARSAMQRLGGTAKTTGAGGGDVAIAVIPATVDVTIATRSLIECGCQPISLAVDASGVDLRVTAS